jgi:hypothetical protein
LIISVAFLEGFEHRFVTRAGLCAVHHCGFDIFLRSGDVASTLRGLKVRLGRTSFSSAPTAS